MPTTTSNISRRQLLQGTAASSVVVGWNAASGAWVTAKAARSFAFEAAYFRTVTVAIEAE